MAEQSTTIDLSDWPRCDDQINRYLCTEDRPMPKGAAGPWRHTRTREIGEQEDGWPAGDIVTVECLNCGTTWKRELPQ